jgi:hypothetical protein
MYFVTSLNFFSMSFLKSSTKYFSTLVKSVLLKTLVLFPFAFVEAGFMWHIKSYRNRSRVRLPVVADAFGLTGRGWASSWLEARRAAGLDAARDGFLLPTVIGPFPSMMLGCRRASTSEVSSLIKEIFMAAEAGWDLSRVGAHSLKPTLLSWCAKFGLPLATRRKLGGHAKGRDKSALAYSRDEMSEPMRELQRVVKAVKEGSFFPDSTRSGLLRPGAAMDSGVPEEPAGELAPQSPALTPPDDGFDVPLLPDVSMNSEGSLATSSGNPRQTGDPRDGSVPAPLIPTIDGDDKDDSRNHADDDVDDNDDDDQHDHEHERPRRQ